MGEVRKIFVVPFNENPFYKAETVETLTVSNMIKLTYSSYCVIYTETYVDTVNSTFAEQCNYREICTLVKSTW